jgi:hypothetical protein
MGGVGLWELMASGGLPALAKLTLYLHGRWQGCAGKIRVRLAPAFEAVAGTLTHLHLGKPGYSFYDEWLSDEVDVGYELGVAVCKLRRLKDLAFDLSEDGLIYHAVAQGLTASGADRSLPVLWRVRVSEPGEGYRAANIDLVASLVLPLPSVEVFVTLTSHYLLVACALRQAGYKHTWVTSGWNWPEEVKAPREVAQCRVYSMGCHYQTDRIPLPE